MTREENNYYGKQYRQRTKMMLLTSMGSKCVICGYSKCSRALEFHHLNKNEKKFSFGNAIATHATWSELEEELKKCILVCSNCHKEIEDELVDDSVYFSTYDSSLILEDISGLKLNGRNYGLRKCAMCDTTFRPVSAVHKVCSLPCRDKYRKTMINVSNRKKRPKFKIKWPTVGALKTMVKLYGYSGVGRKLGVSNTAVKKRIQTREKYQRNKE